MQHNSLPLVSILIQSPGFRWLVIFMAEYGTMFAVSGIACLMFLGGWSTGLPFELTTLFSESLDLGFFGVVVGNVINVVSHRDN